MHSDFEKATLAYIIKILYGPLCGLEIPLGAGRHFFVSAHDDNVGAAVSGMSNDGIRPDSENSALAQTHGTYLVPGPMRGPDGQPDSVPNFAIVLGHAMHPTGRSSTRTLEPGEHDHDGFTNPGPGAIGNGQDTIAVVEIYADTRGPAARQDTLPLQRSFHVQEGELFEYGDVRFAWKRQGEPWSFEDVHATCETSLARGRESSTANHAAAAELPRPNDHALQNASLYRSAPSHANRRWTGWGLAIFCPAAAIAAMVLITNIGGGPPDLIAVEAAMRGAPAGSQIREGRDGKPYVLVRSERDATWAMQALRRRGSDASANVRIEREEVQRLEAALERQGVPFYVVRFDAPNAVRLLLVGEPSSTSQRADHALRDDVLGRVPYVDTVRIDRYPTSAIVAKARAGLDALGIRYRQVQRGGTMTLELDSAMDDARLAELGRFAQSFSREWGHHSVHIVLEPQSEGMPVRALTIRARGYVSTGGDAIEFTSPVS